MSSLIRTNTVQTENLQADRPQLALCLSWKLRLQPCVWQLPHCQSLGGLYSSDIQNLHTAQRRDLPAPSYDDVLKTPQYLAHGFDFPLEWVLVTNVFLFGSFVWSSLGHSPPMMVNFHFQLDWIKEVDKGLERWLSEQLRPLVAGLEEPGSIASTCHFQKGLTEQDSGDTKGTWRKESQLSTGFSLAVLPDPARCLQAATCFQGNASCHTFPHHRGLHSVMSSRAFDNDNKEKPERTRTQPLYCT